MSEKNKEAQRKHYRKYRDYYIKLKGEEKRERRLKLQEWIRGIKDTPCVDCGIKYISCVMEFDHRPGTVKVDEIADLVSAMYSKNRILKEIEKCDLVCANCHRIRTFRRGVSQW